MMTRVLVALTVIAVFWGSSVRSQDTFVYQGFCDASAAIALDADHFVVAQDEVNSLWIFRRGVPLAVREMSLNNIIGADEADIEGTTRIRDRIYWITSHGANKNGKYRENRRRFFATDISYSNGIPEISIVGVYKGLVADLIAHSALKDLGINISASSERAPESEIGLNIEGLASTPEGYLLIAFRNPRTTKGEAMILTLRNPEAVIKGYKPDFGKLHLLNLEGRGIRSIERVGNQYFIVAGPHGKAETGTFQIWTWDSDSGEVKFDKAKTDQLGDFRPEALFEIPNTRQLQLLSDDGEFKHGRDKICKEWTEGQFFRSKIISLN